MHRNTIPTCCDAAWSGSRRYQPSLSSFGRNLDGESLTAPTDLENGRLRDRSPPLVGVTCGFLGLTKQRGAGKGCPARGGGQGAVAGFWFWPGDCTPGVRHYAEDSIAADLEPQSRGDDACSLFGDHGGVRGSFIPEQPCGNHDPGIRTPRVCDNAGLESDNFFDHGAPSSAWTWKGTVRLSAVPGLADLAPDGSLVSMLEEDTARTMHIFLTPSLARCWRGVCPPMLLKLSSASGGTFLAIFGFF